jgi:hypothetical protein
MHEINERLGSELQRKYVTPAQWFRVADLYLKLSHGNISPINIGNVHSELLHLQNCSRDLAEFCSGRLFVYFGVGVGDTEMALADVVTQARHLWEGVLVDINPVFLKMFIRSLENRALEDGQNRFSYVAVQDLFEDLKKTAISPNNSQSNGRLFVCLGSTIGNFEASDEIWTLWTRLAEKGDRALVGYQTNKYLPIVFEKYRSHSGYRALIGNFLSAEERQTIEWKLNRPSSSIEAWYGDVQIFRTRKFTHEEVKIGAARHGWTEEFARLDSRENVCLQAFVKT